MIAEDAWLTEVVGRPFFRVGDAVTAAEAAAHADVHLGASYYTRVPTADTPRAAALADAGFRVVDCGVTLERDPADPPRAPACVVRARPDHVEAVARIGGEAFGMTRFHLDPGMPPGAADRIKAAWARNCATGARGVATLVAVHDGAPAGFLSVMAAGDDYVIDLVAVDAAHRGRGLGRALVAAFIAGFAPAARVLRVGTQAANIASLRLYESLGFRMASTAYAMHRHT
ncbi:MAG TPA: GNAT family N-acetyltransferase [Miltoncostaeaceae bacterium]|nr:GNAT family N-acetyltransferase [Miltoncostaeaceae bacterium]